MKANNNALRFSLVGAGRIAQTHLDALARISEAELVSIVEPRTGAGKSAAERYDCRHYEDYRHPEILDGIDAALICTPPNLHAKMAGHFMEAGKHVLCEKPLTINSADAVEMVRLSEKQGVVLMMASKFRYVDDVIKAKSLVESGILGELLLYENAFCAKISMKERWNCDPKTSGGGVLIDNGSHSVDIARYLLGPITSVQAQLGKSTQELDVEDTVRVQIRTTGGTLGTVDLSWSYNKESESYVNVYGTEGTLLIGWAGSRYRQDGSPRWTPFGNGYDKLAAFRGQLENFIGTVRGAEQPLITPEDALASVQAIEAAYTSASRDKWQGLEGSSS